MKAKEWAKLLKEKFESVKGELTEEFFKLIAGLHSECEEIFRNRATPKLLEGRLYDDRDDNVFKQNFVSTMVSALREACVKWDGVATRLEATLEYEGTYPVIFERGYFAYHKLSKMLMESLKSHAEGQHDAEALQFAVDNIWEIAAGLGYETKAFTVLRSSCQKLTIKYRHVFMEEYLVLMSKIGEMQKENHEEAIKFVMANKRRILQLRELLHRDDKETNAILAAV